MKRIPLVVALLMLGGCSIFESGSNVEPPAELVDFKPTMKVDELWSRDIGKGPGDVFLRLTPAEQGNTLYVTDLRGRVQALDAGNGNDRWRTDLDLEVSAGPGLGDDLVVVATHKGQVVALDRRDGKERWRAQVTSEVLAPPAVGDGVVVVQSVDGRVAAFAADSGKSLWTFERSEPALSLRGTSTPVLVADAVLAGFGSGKLVALNLRDGRLLWEVPVAEPHGRTEIERLIDVDTPVLVTARALIAAAYQGKIEAVSLENGRLLWSREISTYSALSADVNNVYVSDAGGIVYALDLRSGATVWKQDQLHGRQLSAPMVTGQAVAVGDFDGYIHWLSRDDGHFLVRTRIASAAILAPPLADGTTLYVEAQNGELAAYRLESR
jgi:outer membrane protein assembly factor BamB